MKIAIIGAGNGGQAMAGHFKLLGHKVKLYNRTGSRIAAIVHNRMITLTDQLDATVNLDLITDNLETAVKDVELIMITTTADAHKSIANEITHYITEGQTIILNPGRTLGAVEFSAELKKYFDKRVYIGEAQSLIYACRSEMPGQVRVIGIKDKVLLAAYPHSDTGHVLNIVNSVYPCFVKAGNVLETSLENIGAILHPSVILFNAATIERGHGFYFYNDITPAVSGFIEQIDQERLMIGQAFGLHLKSVSEWVSFAYNGISGNDLCEKVRNNPAYHKILAPKSLHCRMLLEDIPTGIIPMIELGRLGGVKTPLMEAVLHITEALLKMDFKHSGRTLIKLGMDKLQKDEFLKLL